MTREQLKANGWVETMPGCFRKGTEHQLSTPDHQITVGGIEKPCPKRIRQSSKPLLNKLETEWRNCLETKYPDRTIYPQALRFRLANGAWYKPDLAMWDYGFLCCYEVKGPKGMKGQPKGLMTLKIAAAQYPEADWYLVWKEDGKWQEQLVLP